MRSGLALRMTTEEMSPSTFKGALHNFFLERVLVTQSCSLQLEVLWIVSLLILFSVHHHYKHKLIYKLHLLKYNVLKKMIIYSDV